MPLCIISTELVNPNDFEVRRIITFSCFGLNGCVLLDMIVFQSKKKQKPIASTQLTCIIIFNNDND